MDRYITSYYDDEGDLVEIYESPEFARETRNADRVRSGSSARRRTRRVRRRRPQYPEPRPRDPREDREDREGRDGALVKVTRARVGGLILLAAEAFAAFRALPTEPPVTGDRDTDHKNQNLHRQALAEYNRGGEQIHALANVIQQGIELVFGED